MLHHFHRVVTMVGSGAYREGSKPIQPS